MTSPARLFGPGLQPERTVLAWRRTSLSLAAGSLGITRLLAATLGAGALVLTAVGAVLAFAMVAVSARRARRLEAVLLAGDCHVHGPGGALVAVTALGCLLVGMLALAVVLALGLSPDRGWL